jgi:uncharacterized protein YceH (UPF0502 family)
MESNSPQSNPEESDGLSNDIRKRVEKLQEKVVELSKTFDHIEETASSNLSDQETEQT